MSVVVEPRWRELLEALSGETGAEGVLKVHVLGSSDTGKTTLCRWIGDELRGRGRRVAGIDCDPGQSAIGPPAAVGMGWEPCREGEAEALRFVGHVTPSGHFLQLLSGVVALDRRARRAGADAVVHDASGYMDTAAGREYHTLLVDATAGGGPAGHLVALQRKDELEEVLRVFDRRTDVEVHRLAPSPAVDPRGRERRRSYRRERFRRYFAGAELHELPLDGLGLHGRVPDLRRPDRLHGLLAAPVAPDGACPVLGVVEGGGSRNGESLLLLRAPAFDTEGVTSLQFGSLRLEPDEWGRGPA